MDDEGRIRIEGKVFIDASGDGNLAFLAGADWVYGDGQGNSQMATQVMRITDMAADADVSPAALMAAITRAKREGTKNLSKDVGIFIKGEAGTGFAILPSISVEDLDAKTLTRCEMNTRKQAQAYLDVFRRYVSRMENCQLASTGPNLGIRETRRILGACTIGGEDVLEARKHPETIARGAWPCERHVDQDKMTEYLWVKDDDYYDIPFGAIQSRSHRNLLAGDSQLQEELRKQNAFI